MAAHEKKKKGFIMSIYKSAARNQSTLVPDPAMVDKKSIQRGWLLRKSKASKGIEQGGQRVMEGGGILLRGEVVEARKSVSHIETNLVLVTDMPEFMQVHAFKCARRTYDDSWRSLALSTWPLT